MVKKTFLIGIIISIIGLVIINYGIYTLQTAKFNELNLTTDLTKQADNYLDVYAYKDKIEYGLSMVEVGMLLTITGFIPIVYSTRKE